MRYNVAFERNKGHDKYIMKTEEMELETLGKRSTQLKKKQVLAGDMMEKENDLSLPSLIKKKQNHN